MGKLTSALLAAVALACAVTVLVGLHLGSSYGTMLFVASPMLGGALAVSIHGRDRKLTGFDVFGVTTLFVLVIAAALLLLAADGLMCIAMALPLAVPMAWIGGAMANWALESRRRRERESRSTAHSLVLLPLLWLGMAVEPALLPEPELQPVSSSVVIAADADTVWDELLGFSQITAPRSWVFSLGIASPESAWLDGEGVGAVRHCVFTTGEFVEPVTRWDPGRELAFDVLEQPAPMVETSIYPDLDPPHLHDFFLSERGRFLIEPLGDGRVRLTGTTWYRQRMWPQFYWNGIADHLIHTIHERVLQHIQQEAERRT